MIIQKYTKEEIQNVLDNRLPCGNPLQSAEHYEMQELAEIQRLLGYVSTEYRKSQEKIYGDVYSLEVVKKKVDAKVEGGWDFLVGLIAQ